MAAVGGGIAPVIIVGIGRPRPLEVGGVSIVQAPQDRFGRLNPNAPPATAQWGQLAGVWDCEIASAGPDGTVRRGRATWTWSYILDGHAVQDVYLGHRGDGGADFYGTDLRTYHPALERWEIVWTSNSVPDGETSRMTAYHATYENEQIVMRYANGNRSWRTVFFDISRDAFRWRNEPSQQAMSCRRTEGPPR